MDTQSEGDPTSKKKTFVLNQEHLDKLIATEGDKTHIANLVDTVENAGALRRMDPKRPPEKDKTSP